MVERSCGGEAHLRDGVKQVGEEVNGHVWGGRADSDLVNDGMLHLPIAVDGLKHSIALRTKTANHLISKTRCYTALAGKGQREQAKLRSAHCAKRISFLEGRSKACACIAP